MAGVVGTLSGSESIDFFVDGCCLGFRCITTAYETFAFKVKTTAQTTNGKELPAIMEGVLRYHPFLYDRETCPRIANGTVEGGEDDEETEAATGSSQSYLPVFNCYWNGRLIPKTNVVKVPFITRMTMKRFGPLKMLEKRLT